MDFFKTLPAGAGSFFAAPRGWLLLLLCFHLCANIWWLSADNHAVSTDEETHMIMARDYYKAMFPHTGDRSPGARLSALARIKADVGNPVHPPLLHVAGAVLTRAIGYGVDRLAFVNTLAFLAAIGGVYLIACGFLEKREAIFAALVFSLTPMIYASSRYFMTDFLSMALVVWVMYALLKTDRFSSVRWSAVYGLLNGLALMTRTTVVLYYFIPSLVVFIMAVAFLVERNEGTLRFNQLGLAKLALNTLLILIITFAVCSPWYIAHGGQFYQHWMKPHKGGSGSPLAILAYTASGQEEESGIGADGGEKKEDGGVTDATGRPKSEEPSPEEAETPSAAPKEQGGGGWRLLLNRKVGWIRYPVFVINNAVFLPMFLLCLLGMVLVPVVPRFRRRFTAWVLLSWLLGSYVLLTLVLNFGTPRYAMQALPALAVLSALPVFALPKGKGRLAALILYTALLVFQYGNLTVHAYGTIAEAKVPVILDKKYQAVYNDPGLYFYKPVLHASSAYGRMKAPTRENFKDRLFFSMLKAERERPFSGIEAPYARLNIRGMILDEEHFWLDDTGGNPFRRNDIPPELAPYRNFRHYGWGKDMESVRPVLSLVDYVAYTTEGISAEKDREWQRILAGRGFEVIDRFHEKRFGMVPAMDYVLMARNEENPPPRVETEADIWKLGPEQLYQCRYSAAYQGMEEGLRQSLTARMRALFDKIGHPVKINDDVEFRGAAVFKNPHGGYVLQFILYVRNRPDKNYRMLFRGIVEPQFMETHFQAQQDRSGLFRWNFDPTPAPTHWPEEDFVLLRFPMEVPPIPYHLSFAFYTADDGVWGDAVDLGKIDFRTVE